MKKIKTSLFGFSVKNSKKHFQSFCCFSGKLANSEMNTQPTFFSRKKIVRGYSKIHELKLVTIGIASPEKIQFWAEKELPNGKIFGEVTNANTFHYRTFKPSKGGLFCERIFGPLKDFECACGKRQRPTALESKKILEHKQTVRSFCPNCDVEYTWSILRRYQLGYIKLSAPVVHLWYFKTNPSYLSILFDMKRKDLESLIYCTETVTLENTWNFSEKTLSFQQSPAKFYETWQKFFQKEETIKTSQQKFLGKKARERSQKVAFRQGWAFDENSKEKQMWKNVQKNMAKNQPSFFSISSNEKSSQTENLLQQNLLLKRKHFLQVFFQENWKQLLFQTMTKASETASPEFSFLVFQTFFEFSRLFLFDFEQNHEMWSFLSMKSSLSSYKDRDFNEKTWKSLFFRFEVLKHFERKILVQQKLSEPISKENFLFLMNLIPFYKKLVLLKKLDYHTTPSSNLLRKIQKRLAKNEKKILPFFSEQRKKLNFGNFLAFPFGEKNEKILSSLRNFELNLLQEKKNIFDSIDQKRKDPFLFSSENFSSFQLLLKNAKRNSDGNLCLVLDLTSQNLENLLYSETTENDKLNFFLEKTSLLKETEKKNTKEFKKLLFSFMWFFFSEKNFQRKPDEKTSLLFLKTETPVFSEQFQKKSIEILNKPSSLKTEFFEKKRKVQSDLIFKYFCEHSLEKRTDQFALKLLKKISPDWSQKRNFLGPYILKGIRTKNGEPSTKPEILKIKKNFQLSGKRWSVQNIVSTTSYNARWGNDSDWRYFAYFMSLFSSEIEDSPMFFCSLVTPNSKFQNSLFFPTESFQDKTGASVLKNRREAFSVGAGIVEKFLTEYTSSELKKMITQHQILLPKIQQSMTILKETATKKKDFLQIQKYAQKREHILRRLKLLRKFSRRNSNPQSMILKNLPVLPPDLRPILKIQNQIAASDLNRFYQRILYRNERLKKFQKDSGTNQSFEIKYAQRLLQEAVDNLIQNGKGKVKPETNSRGQPLKSLSEILKGKQGRFRQYLLGKRVDYSGRSVIIVGPKLKIYECGLPKEMALELFLPFLIQHILKYKLAQTVIGAKNILQSDPIFTVQLLQKVLKNSPVLLNRAPTLHKLGFQAFLPKLVEGRAILLHPMVCPGFNADFDGDQMAVHIPLTVEARTEAWKFMLSSNNLLTAATGEPILLPSQDMVLGCYYLTLDFQKKFVGVQVTNSFEKDQGKSVKNWLQKKKSFLIYKNFSEVLQHYDKEEIHLHTPVWVKTNSKLDFGNDSSKPREIQIRKNGEWHQIFPKYSLSWTSENKEISKYIRTTPGRILMNSMIQECSSYSFEPGV